MKTSVWFSIFILSLSNFVFSQTGWNPVNVNSTVNLQGIQFPSGNVGYIVGDAGTLLKSTNGGNSWFQQNTGTSFGLMDVNFSNELTGWVVGQNGTILHSTNGGNEWVKRSYQTNHFIYQSYFFDENSGWVVGGYGTVLKTINGGVNWNSKSIGTSNTLLGVRFLNSSVGWIIGDYGTIYFTIDGGNNWVSQWFGFTNNLSQMSFLSTSTGWISATNGLVIKTTNSGLNWQVQNTGISNWLTTVFFVSPTVGWAAGSPATIVKTTNGGSNWFVQYSNSAVTFNASFFLNALTGFVVGSNGTLLKTTNGGLSIPASPQLISPPNNSLNQSLTPTMTWSNTGGDYYSIQISTTPTFTVLSDSASVPATQYVVPQGKLLPAITYFWRVNATNGGGTSPWSDVWSFSTVLAPPAPTLLTPLNGESNVCLTPVFSWSNIPSATYYHIVIMLSSGSIVDSVTLNTNSYSIPAGKLSISNTYYWNVFAGNNNGAGPCSQTFNFMTIAPPPAPVLIYPENGMVDVSQTPTLDWGDLNSADYFKVEVSTVSDFAVITDSATVTSSQYTVPQGKLQLYYTYFWRVNATNSYGTGSWSAVWRFTVSIIGLRSISSGVPGAFKLYINYPNPFNPVTKIKFDIPNRVQTQLVIFDALGRVIESLVNKELQAGTYEFTWNASKYNSGVYFVRIVSGTFTETKKMVLLK